MSAIVTVPVRQRWATTDVDPRRALSYWADTICRSFLEVDIDCARPQQFHASLEQAPLGPAMLSLIEAEPQIVRRTPARISHSRYAGYFLFQLRIGQAVLRQYGRECRVEAGDCALVDCSAPYWLECLSATRSVALHFPTDWLRNWIPSPQSLAARPFRSNAGWSTTLAGALANLDTNDLGELALPEGVVAEQIAALLALAAGPHAHILRGSEKLLHRIRRTLRDRCHEPGLSTDAVAAEHGISKRYLHYLFAHADSTFGSELMSMRLNCAHRLLSDLRFSGLTIGEVASRSGFLDLSHFARRFRAAYGVGPKDFRCRQFLAVRESA